MKMKKVIAAALVGFMAMGLLAGCGGGKEDENNTLRIGMECGYAPFNWTQRSTFFFAMINAPFSRFLQISPEVP